MHFSSKNIVGDALIMGNATSKDEAERAFEDLRVDHDRTRKALEDTRRVLAALQDRVTTLERKALRDEVFEAKPFDDSKGGRDREDDLI